MARGSPDENVTVSMEEAAQNQSQSPSQSPGPASKREVHITAGAVQYAKKRIAARGTPDAAVRLGVRGGGCSGFNYVIEFSDEPARPRDTVTVLDGVKFYVDKKSLIYLAGSTLDYEHTLMFQGFRFRNPQEASRCGCGHSFTVR